VGILHNLIVKITGDKTQLDNTLQGAGRSVNTFGSVVRKIGGYIAAAFSITIITGFVKSCIQAAVAAEGIMNAFRRIGSPEIMGQLKEATRGLFEEEALAKYAIQAKNLGIPLRDLSRYLEFATKRAITTGKSIEELTEAIITGVGRKSTRSLIQLGISVTDLQNELKKTGDFTIALGNIMDRELTAMGEVTDTTAVKFRQVKTAWQEFKESLGNKIVSSEWFQNLLGGLKNLTSMLSGPKQAGINDPYAKWRNLTKEQINILIPQTKEQIEYFKGLKGGEASLQFWVEGLKVLNDQLDHVPPPGSTGSIITGEKIKRIGAPSKVSAGHIAMPGITMPETAGLQGMEYNLQALKEYNDRLKEEMDRMQDVLSAGRDMAVEGVADLIEGIGEAFGGVDKDLGRELLLSFASFMSQFGRMLILSGIGMMTLNPKKGAQMIAAGSAMLLTAGIVKGTMNKESTTSSRGGGYAGTTSTQTMKVVVVGKISGKDLALVMRRNE